MKSICTILFLILLLTSCGSIQPAIINLKWVKQINDGGSFYYTPKSSEIINCTVIRIQTSNQWIKIANGISKRSVIINAKTKDGKTYSFGHTQYTGVFTTLKSRSPNEIRSGDKIKLFVNSDNYLVEVSK